VKLEFREPRATLDPQAHRVFRVFAETPVPRVILAPRASQDPREMMETLVQRVPRETLVKMELRLPFWDPTAALVTCQLLATTLVMVTLSVVPCMFGTVMSSSTLDRSRDLRDLKVHRDLLDLAV
jgi:hypothetical protein